MKFTINGPFKENIYGLMRKTGYHFQRKDNITSEIVFSRPAQGYPRFHIYLKEKNDWLIINLHLDQKKPTYSNKIKPKSKDWQKIAPDESYKRLTAHSGEYQGEIIEKEAQRIKQILEDNH